MTHEGLDKLPLMDVSDNETKEKDVGGPEIFIGGVNNENTRLDGAHETLTPSTAALEQRRDG